MSMVITVISKKQQNTLRSMVITTLMVVLALILLLLETTVAEDIPQPSPAALQELHKVVCSLKPELPECARSVSPSLDRQNSKVVAGAPRPRRRSSIKGASPWRPLGSDTNWYQDYYTWKMQQQKEGYISFGAMAYDGQFPHALSIQLTNYGNAHMCTGALIDKRHVLTAGHCVKTFAAQQSLNQVLRIVMGAVDTDPLSQLPSTAIVRGVELSILHESYDDQLLQNDIGMFRLDADVLVTGKVEDVDLALSNTPQSINTVVNVNGYGLIEGATSTSLLHQVNVSIVDSSMCSNFYTSFNADRNICTFDPIRNAGPCPGDSGSSLVLYTPPESQSNTPRTLASSQATALDRRWISVGIVSGGKNVPCGTPGSPAFYTRVSYYLPWIQSKLTAYWQTRSDAGTVLQPPTPQPTTGSNTGGGGGGGTVTNPPTSSSATETRRYSLLVALMAYLLFLCIAM